MRERIEAGVGLAVSVLGLAAYLYLLGGLVWWLRFTAARLPADQAVSAIGGKRLLTTGLKAFLFEAVILVVLWLLALGAWRLARKSTKGSAGQPVAPNDKTANGEGSQRPKHTPISWSTVLFGICLGIELLALLFGLKNWLPRGVVIPQSFQGWVGGVIGAFAAAFFDERSNWNEKLKKPAIRWKLSIPLALGAIVIFSAPAGIAILVLLILAHLSGGLDELPSIEEPVKLVPAVLIVGAGFGLVAAAYEATPPVSLERVAVVTANGEIVGGYVGESSDELTVAHCSGDRVDPQVNPRPPKLKVIPKSEITATYLGGPQYAFDYGRKPSVLDLLKHYLGESEIDEILDTVSIDPRGNRLVCGDARSFRIVRAVADKSRGVAKERIIVHGAGVVSLGGADVEPSQLTLDHNGAIWLPIIPLDAARAEVGLLGYAEVDVWTRFELEGGDTTTVSKQVRLFRRRTY